MEVLSLMDISKEVSGLMDNIIQIRRHLHMYPEIGFNETATHKYIMNYLKKLNLDSLTSIAKTGVKGVLKAQNAVKTIAFRADMDALLISENNQIDYKSKNKGIMHACGHDGHMSVLLAFAELATRYRDSLNVNLVFLFQPAEEGPGGAEKMIEEGALKDPDVDEIYGLHMFPELDEGKLGITTGPAFAGVHEFDIFIKGKSAHGAMPHKGIDSIVIASQLMGMLQCVLNRNVDPFESAVISIGKITGGERRNIIAEFTKLEGTLRTFSNDVHNAIVNKINSIIKGLEKAHKAEIEFIDLEIYPTVHNDYAVCNQLEQIFGEDLVELPPLMIGEDFAFYLDKIPGVFFLLGCRNMVGGFIHPLHNNRFDFDENALLYGVQAYMDIIQPYISPKYND